jgi:hypothetical protein
MLEVNPYHELLLSMETGSDLTPLAERYSLALEYARERMGGRVYENPVVRLVHSLEGIFYEFKDFPDFSYAHFGKLSGEFLGEADAQAVLWDSLILGEEGDAEVMVLYGPDYLDEESFYFAYSSADTSYTRGNPRVSPPLFLWLDDGERRLIMVRTEGGYLVFNTSGGQPVLAPLKE